MYTSDFPLIDKKTAWPAPWPKAYSPPPAVQPHTAGKSQQPMCHDPGVQTVIIAQDYISTERHCNLIYMYMHTHAPRFTIGWHKEHTGMQGCSSVRGLSTCTNNVMYCRSRGQQRTVSKFPELGRIEDIRPSFQIISGGGDTPGPPEEAAPSGPPTPPPPNIWIRHWIIPLLFFLWCPLYMEDIRLSVTMTACTCNGGEVRVLPEVSYHPIYH